MLTLLNPANPPEKELRRKLIWLMLFRLVVVTVLLGGTLLFNRGELDAPVNVFLSLLVLLTYLLTIFYASLIRAMRSLVPLAYLQLLGDLFINTGLVYVTGGVESGFLFFYSLTIINAAILLYQNGAFMAAAVGTFLLAAMTTQQTTDLFPDALNIVLKWIYGGDFPAPRDPWTAFAVNSGVFFAIATISSYLVKQLRQASQTIAEQKEDFAELSALHTSIVHSLNSGLITLDRAGKIRFANRAAESLSGRTRGELVGAELEHVLPPLASVVRRMGSGKENLPRLTFSHTLPKGQERFFGVSLSALTDRHGAQMGTLLIFQDLTRYREMEHAVRDAEKLAAIGELSAGLAHEIRNPLASMSGSIELIMRSATELGDDEQRLFKIVQQEMGRLNELIGDFLAYARPRPPQMQEIDLVDLLTETLSVFRHEMPNEAVRLDHAWPRHLALTADPALLRQVLWNLLKNAEQALHGNGTLRVAAENLSDTATGGVRLTVEDSGEGMSGETLEKVFTPFFTTKPGGTGLGLALVHKIVHAHGGRVNIRSTQLTGTRVEIIFPARPPDADGNKP